MSKFQTMIQTGICVWLSLCVWQALPAGATVAEQVKVPDPLGYVSDYAEILDDTWQERIRLVCKELEDRTEIEMLVVTVDTVRPLASTQEYASKLYEAWRIGTAQQERGMLLLTSLKERQAVVVLGRNLLSAVTKTRLDELMANHFIPMFETAEFGEHLYKTTVLLASDAGKGLTRTGERKKSSHAGFWMNVAVAVAMIFALWRFTRPERRHPFQRWRRGDYWRTGQGGFGGNFGGFGGGMSGRGLS